MWCVCGVYLCVNTSAESLHIKCRERGEEQLRAAQVSLQLSAHPALGLLQGFFPLSCAVIFLLVPFHSALFFLLST